LGVQSQDEVHSEFGGIVPELASRAHLKNLLPVLKKVLDESGWTLDQVDVFASTTEPGLIGSLLVGHTAAKTLSLLFGGTLISCHHLEGHLLSVFLEEKKPRFPFVALLVSGGHSSFYWVKDYDQYELLGQTLDDAMGEAFDKGAQIFGLGFPGGAALEKFSIEGDSDRFSFPSVRVEGPNLSFSGLKSQLVRFKKSIPHPELNKDLAASYQKALIDHVETKLKRVFELTGPADLVLVGGVARNQSLRDRLKNLQGENKARDLFYPRLELCTDNAAMIGVRAYRKFLKSEFSNLESDVGPTRRPPRKPKR
jgi:N6-L-threonylcarbamoyladenine synthase